MSSQPVTESGLDVFRWLIAAFNDHDLATARRAWTPETVHRFPDAICRGPDEIAGYVEDQFAALEGWHMDVVAAAERGESVFVRWRLTGRHVGPILGVAATGRPLAIDGIDHATVRDGKLVSNFVVSDQLDAARQLGLMPAAGSLAETALKRAFNATTWLGRRRRGAA